MRDKTGNEGCILCGKNKPSEALLERAEGMRALWEIASALFAVEGYSLPGRSAQQNCRVIRGILRVDIRYDEGKENRPVGSVRQRKSRRYFFSSSIRHLTGEGTTGKEKNKGNSQD